MSFKLIFANNQTLVVQATDTIHAWKNDTSYLNVGEDQAFYLEEIFKGTSESITTETHTNPLASLAGLLADADWLTLDDQPTTYYQTSNIVSLTTE
ncbi:hypothetical protein [Latilactobacillus fuchuensis]|jgi:hypothetical protein|uniref:Prophage protein n=2 Tax=Latilactobacillus fuchuensis TaxID=164393 RepID=A0A2N9DWE6_9LACO|nr:hypothetical protein [Latilactobacillus fuchuensis]KRL58851.1 hypothetical protein FC69_GL000054 [Latilactobacillus fuchuensis DSM 14340 = JCM 11249]MCP8858061.1 hypothetical protein [Latilactobacillus fuchuensis]SPC39000.1 conserved hypothetical protein [Latilactobacillus fuchuensis]